jgi:hypothetical protein
VLAEFLKRQVLKNRALIHEEAGRIQDFLRLLMKQRNTGEKWTDEEIRLLKAHFVRLACYIPALCVVIMPFGILFLPVIAEALDRRSKRRLSEDTRV